MKVRSKPWDGKRFLKYVHLKMDGHYTRIVKNEQGVIIVTSSIGTVLTHKVQDFPWMMPIVDIPNATTILGEMYAIGHTASDIKTLLNAQDDRVRFGAFALERLEGNYDIGDWSLEDMARWFRCHNIEMLPWRLYKGETPEQLFEDLPSHAEGYVLKDGNKLNWQKIKPVRTIDLIVDSFTDGEGKYFGFIGAIVCRVNEGPIVANVSGMTDGQRYEMTLNQKEYVGRICEVAYQNIGSQGKLRHPRFIRWRDDKNADGCGLDQDPDLEPHHDVQ